MKSLIAAAAFAALALATPAGAQVYATVGYTAVDVNPVNLGALGGRVGYRINPYVGVEAEANFGVDDDKVDVLGVPVKVELKRSVAAYAVGFWPATEKLDLFIRAGYGNVKIKASAFGVSASGDDSGWNAGVGGQYFFTPKDGVRGEYTKYGLESNGVDADTWSISYVRKF